MRTITFNHTINDVLTDVTSVRLRDPGNTFGVRRTDTNGIVVAAGTPLIHIATGRYEYEINEPALGLSYEYWLEFVYQGNTSRVRQFLSGSPSHGGSGGGSVPVPPSQFVARGIRIVACGDLTLESLLAQQAPVLWALQARLGTSIDLRWVLFKRALVMAAQPHVRRLVDRAISDERTQETGYANGSNVSDSQMNSSRIASTSSTQSSSAVQSSSRSALRTTSSTMDADADQTSSRTASGSDTSEQTQTSDTNRTSANNSVTSTTPSLHMTDRQFKRSHMHSEANSYVTDDFTRGTYTFPFMGQVSGQYGGKAIPQPQNQSFVEMDSQDNGEIHSVRGTKVIGDGLSVDDQTTEADGSHINRVTREMTSSMVGSAHTVSQSAMSFTAHSESHRESESSFRSESNSHAEMTASSTSHSESQGASSMVASGSSIREYYSQLFDALQTMLEDCNKEIERLEQQVNMTTRTVMRKMTVKTPQARLIGTNTPTITNSPFGPNLLGGGIDRRTIR